MDNKQIEIPVNSLEKIIVSSWKDKQVIQIETESTNQHFMKFVNIPASSLPELIEALTKLNNNG